MSIADSIKRLVKHSAVYGLGHILNRSIGFILLPLYTNLFSTGAFGIAGLMMTYLTILTLLYAYGLDAGFMRHYVLANSAEQRRTIFSTAFIALLGSSLLFSSLIALFANDLSQFLFSAASQRTEVDLKLLFYLLAGILFCDTTVFIPLLVLRAEEKSWWFVTIKLANGVINLAANILFVLVWRFGVEGIFLANLVASAITLLLTVPTIVRLSVPHFSGEKFKQLAAFGLPFLFSGTAIALMDTIDRIFLERLQSVQMVGLYNAGTKLGMVMGLVVAAFRFAWQPYFLTTSKQSDAKVIFSRIFTYLVLTGAALIMGMTFFIDGFVRLRLGSYTLFGSEYWSSTAVVPTIMLAYFLYAFYLVFEAGLYLTGKSLHIAVITLLGLLVNGLVNFWAVPIWGLHGAAWARVAAYGFMAAGLYVFGQRFYPIAFEWPRVWRVILLTAVLILVGRYLVPPPAWLLKAGLCLLFPLILKWSGFFITGEKNIIAARFKGKIKRER
jgi:O-antigen/teichoic acid export membrane protein